MESNEMLDDQEVLIHGITWFGSPMTELELQKILVTDNVDKKIALCSCMYPYGTAHMSKPIHGEKTLTLDPFRIQCQFGIKLGGYGISFCGLVNPETALYQSPHIGRVAFSVYSDPRYEIFQKDPDQYKDDPTFPRNMVFISDIKLNLKTMQWEWELDS